MQAISYIVIGLILLIVTGAVVKILRDRKKGVKCPGCPGCADNTACQSCSRYHTHISE